jgi:hypothetical protein
MKTILLVSALVISVLCSIGLAVSASTYQQKSEAHYAGIKDKNVKLEEKVAYLDKKVKRYESIDVKLLIQLCTDQAKSNYSTYIREHSIVSKQGSVTTLAPKSPEVIRDAEKKLVADEAKCKENFS